MTVPAASSSGRAHRAPQAISRRTSHRSRPGSSGTTLCTRPPRSSSRRGEQGCPSKCSRHHRGRRGRPSSSSGSRPSRCHAALLHAMAPQWQCSSGRPDPRHLPPGALRGSPVLVGRQHSRLVAGRLGKGAAARRSLGQAAQERRVPPEAASRAQACMALRPSSCNSSWSSGGSSSSSSGSRAGLPHSQAAASHTLGRGGAALGLPPPMACSVSSSRGGAALLALSA